MMNRIARRTSPITPLLLLILGLAPATLAQRIIPESSSWNTLPASHPLGSGEITGTNTFTSSSQAGATLAATRRGLFRISKFQDRPERHS